MEKSHRFSAASIYCIIIFNIKRAINLWLLLFSNFLSSFIYFLIHSCVRVELNRIERRDETVHNFLFIVCIIQFCWWMMCLLGINTNFFAFFYLRDKANLIFMSSDQFNSCKTFQQFTLEFIGFSKILSKKTKFIKN